MRSSAGWAVWRAQPASIREIKTRLGSAYRLLRNCERNVRKRARQTKPSAPPVQARDLFWWRRRFCLRIANLSPPLKRDNNLQNTRLQLQQLLKLGQLPQPGKLRI